MHPANRSGFLTLILIMILFLCLPSPAIAANRDIVVSTTTDPLVFVPVTTEPTLNYVRLTTAATEAPQIGMISISSTPEGATVIIDGTTMGTTPYTIRTLIVGSHSLVLQMNGYLDYSTSFTIQSDQLNQQSYTLSPVPAFTRLTAVPGTTVQETRATVTTQVTHVQTIVVTPTTATSAVTRPLPQPTVTRVTPGPTAAQPPEIRTLADQLAALGPVTIQPVTIRVGNHTKTPLLNTLSPYFSYQFNVANVISPIGYHLPTVVTFPVSFIEVDTMNTYLPTSSLMASGDATLHPVWGDDDTVYIAPTDKFYNSTGFRWISIDPDATGFYQVSRYPFSDNATDWQNQYVPGLVASGPVKDVHVDSEGYHYFILNFAPIANHDPSDPPFYTGIVNLETTVPGQGKPMGLAKIPLTSTGLWYKKANLGPFTIPVPSSLADIPAGTVTENDVANPNENMILSDASTSFLHESSAIASAMADMDSTYYVRVVPIGKNGSGGIPTMPVTVTVKRPHPCPTKASDTQATVLVNLPSAQISSFYMTLLIPDWIRTDQNGALVSRAHFVTVAKPPMCDAPVTGNSMIDSNNAQFCTMYGGSEPGYHFYADPAESHWYDTVWDIIKGLFMALKTVANSVSAAWNQINNLVVQIAAYAVQGLTFGAFDCNSSPACTGLLHAALSVAESSLGIPPTLPNAADLENMGADYMAKMAADQIGAGGALDAAQSAYSAMPDSAKQTIKDNADDIGSQMGDAVGAQSSAVVAGAAGNFYIPDPLYYQPHPATAIVKVTNPNNVVTDPVSMTVKDSGGFYKSANVMVPSLAPMDSTVIPVILNEDFSKGYTSVCNNQQWTSTDGVPCFWDNWQLAARNYGTDTFVITFAAKKNGQWIYGLTPSSSGKVLSNQNIITLDPEGVQCPGYTSTTVLKYPSGWQMYQTPLSQDYNSVMWNGYTFTQGARGRLIGG